MAKKRTKPAKQENGESSTGYFRKLFSENPKLLEGRSNEEVLNHWLADHPSEKEVPGKVKAILSNIKSVMRKKLRKKPGRRPKEEKAAEATTLVVATIPRKVAAKTLETLEEKIDECMNLAKNLDPEGLADVVDALRRARNKVVWKIGE